MSVAPMDFKITPPKVKPQRGISLVLLILRPLVCVLGTSIAPIIVYLVEGFTNLFLGVLGFGSFICVLLLMSDIGKVKEVIQHLKRNCCETTYKRKLLQIPSYNKNLSPLKPSSAAKNSPDLQRCQILDGLDLPQSTTAPNIVEIPISLDCQSSFSGSDVSLQSPIFTPTKRRVISAASVSLEPLKNETETFTQASPFSKRRLGFPGCMSPRHLALKDGSHLSTILESPYADCNRIDLQSRRPSCFSS